MKFTILFFILLAGMTIVIHTYVEEFKPCGSEMLVREWEATVSGTGTVDISGSIFKLVSKDKAARVRFFQKIKDVQPGSMVLLSADMGCRNVEPGEETWHLARLVLVQNDGIKNRYDYLHTVGAISGSREFEHHRKVFSIGPDTQSFTVTAQLTLCTGTFELKNIRMVPVVRTMAYAWTSRAVLMGWVMFAICLVGWTVMVSSYRGRILKGVVIVSFAAIIIGTAMPWEMKKNVVRDVSGQLQQTSHFFDKNISGLLPKFGHFVFFSIFAIAVNLMAGQALWRHALVCILLIAGASELSQFFIEGRSPLIMDFFIDAVGGLLGFVLVCLFNLIFTPTQTVSNGF